MGRMFRIITEGSLDYPGRTSTVSAPESSPYIDGSAPYVEVGGPQPVFHGLPKLPSRIAPPVPTSSTVERNVHPAPTTSRVHAEDSSFIGAKLHGITTKPSVESVPTVHPSIVTFHHPDHPVSGEYLALRDELHKHCGHDHRSRAMLFTSAASDNGTTTVLLNIAVILAREPHTRVLVIDADFDHPSAARKLGLSDVPGLSEVLGQTMPLAWVLQPTPIPKLQVLGAGKPTTETLPLMSSDFPKLVGQLRQWFDWILIDGGVWGERPHRDATSPAYDGVYLVTRQSEMDRPVFSSLRSQVAKHGGLLRGFISTTL